jgi:rod shape-determining protein MreC
MDSGAFSAPEPGAGLLVTPLQKASSGISDAVSGYFQRYVRADELAAENGALQSEVNNCANS